MIDHVLGMGSLIVVLRRKEMFDDFTIMYPGEWLSVYAVVAIQVYCYSQTNLWFLELVSVVF